MAADDVSTTEERMSGPMQVSNAQSPSKYLVVINQAKLLLAEPIDPPRSDPAGL